MQIENILEIETSSWYFHLTKIHSSSMHVIQIMAKFIFFITTNTQSIDLLEMSCELCANAYVASNVAFTNNDRSVSLSR